MTLIFLITSLVTHMVTELPYSDKQTNNTDNQIDIAKGNQIDNKESRQS